jgi:hypothetical protein
MNGASNDGRGSEQENTALNLGGLFAYGRDVKQNLSAVNCDEKRMALH